MARVRYFLNIDGIDGDVTEPTKYEDWIEIESWSWGETNSGQSGSGSGTGTGKISMQDFHFVMLMNDASALLSQACASGRHIAFVELVCYKVETGSEFLKVKMVDVLVSSYQTGGSAHGEVVPTDQVSINFAKIEIGYPKEVPNSVKPEHQGIILRLKAMLKLKP